VARNTGIAGVWESTTDTLPRHPLSRIARKSFFIIQANTRSQTLISFPFCLVKSLPLGTALGFPIGLWQMELLVIHIHKPLALAGMLWFGWRPRHLGVVRVVTGDFSPV